MKYIEILSFRIGREEDIATKRRKRKEIEEWEKTERTSTHLLLNFNMVMCAPLIV